jgi:tRNA(Arg) A34 adenosine deaminase TadA
MLSELDKKYLQMAIDQAQESVDNEGFPAGVVITKNDELIGKGISIGNILNDPTAHGETASIRDACKNIKTADISGAVLYASMQPCLMCFSASLWAGITKIVYACDKSKVSLEYYTGTTDVYLISKESRNPIDLVYAKDFEEQSLNIIKSWEDKIMT